MKESFKTTVRVNGTGDSKQKAFAAALSSVQRTVLKESNNIILRIEPLNVEVVSAEKKVTKEKFLFLFLPRDKELYSVVLDVFVDVTFIDLTCIDFTLIEKGPFSKHNK